MVCACVVYVELCGVCDVWCMLVWYVVCGVFVWGVCMCVPYVMGVSLCVCVVCDGGKGEFSPFFSPPLPIIPQDRKERLLSLSL